MMVLHMTIPDRRVPVTTNLATLMQVAEEAPWDTTVATMVED